MAKTLPPPGGRAASNGKPTPLMLGNLEVTTGEDILTRMALLLWGDINVGKTCFSATAPGRKLWLNLDNEGLHSIMSRRDFHVVDLTGLSTEELAQQLLNSNPLGLDQFLAQHSEFETVVLDSATALAWHGLNKAINDKVGRSSKFSPSLMAPGISAYGGRNAFVISAVQNLLMLTAKHNLHFIVITHEDDPRTSEDGTTESIGMILGGRTVKQFAWRLSEIWYMSVARGASQQRMLAIRPYRLRSPMKSRIFSHTGAAEFPLQYTPERPDTGQKHTLSALYQSWVDGGGKKLPLPSEPSDVRALTRKPA